MNIASLDIKGAYDGVSHQFLFERVEKWRQWGFMSRETMEYMKFLYTVEPVKWGTCITGAPV